MLFEELGPGRGEHHDRTRRPGHQPDEHVQQRFTGPVQILDDHDERPARRGRGGEPGPGPRERFVDRARRRVVQRAAGHRDRGRGREREDRRVHFGLIVTVRSGQQLAQPGAQLLLSEFAGLAQGDAAGVPKDLAERPVRDAVAGGQATPAQNLDVGPALDCGRDHLAYQSTLADPRGATIVTRRGRPLAAASSIKLSTTRVSSSRPTIGGSDSGCGRPAVQSAASSGRAPNRPSRAARAEPEVAVRGPAGPVGDQHGTWLGRLAERGGHIEHVAAEIRTSDRVPGGRRDDITGVDSQPDRYRHPPKDLEPGPERARRVVLTRRRIAEDRYHTAADEPLHCTAPPIDHVAEDVRPRGGFPPGALRVGVARPPRTPRRSAARTVTSLRSSVRGASSGSGRTGSALVPPRPLGRPGVRAAPTGRRRCRRTVAAASSLGATSNSSRRLSTSRPNQRTATCRWPSDAARLIRRACASSCTGSIPTRRSNDATAPRRSPRDSRSLP